MANTRLLTAILAVIDYSQKHSIQRNYWYAVRNET